MMKLKELRKKTGEK